MDYLVQVGPICVNDVDGAPCRVASFNDERVPVRAPFRFEIRLESAYRAPWVARLLAYNDPSKRSPIEVGCVHVSVKHLERDPCPIRRQTREVGGAATDIGHRGAVGELREI